MNQLGFPSHVFAAAIDTDLILFDSDGDRYLALPGALTASARGGVNVGLPDFVLEPGAADALLKAGLMTSAERGGRGIIPLAKPSRMLPVAMPHRGNASATDIISVTSAVLSAGWKLRRGLPCRNFNADRGGGTSSKVEIAHAVHRLREARLLVPHPRRCLPASVVAATFLGRLGDPVQIVFGVRSHPFEAHCWVESEGIVLDDDLDRVRAYTPIAVGRL